MLGMLLRLFVIALIGCSLLAAFTYIYSATTNRVSEYRGHLNAGAYKTQLYLDQREALLRAITATAVHANSRQQLPVETTEPQTGVGAAPH